MNNSDELESARQHVLRHFRWVDGDADTWTMLRDPEALQSIIEALTRVLRDQQIDVVVGIESRGFVLAPAVAIALGVGFSPVRKEGALFPGNVRTQATSPDYRGNTRSLSVRHDHFESGQRVALIDDWIETGNQARAAASLVSQSGAHLVAVGVIIDEASDAARSMLPEIHSIVKAKDLP